MAVGTERRAKKTAARLEQALLLQPLGTTMSFHSSNHTSATAVRDATTPSPVEGLVLANQDSLFQSHQPSSRKRRLSKSKIPGELRRSSSTPHMRNSAPGTPGELSPTSNKPRNKLGYHRTSVACGHCRRRKIRCLLASDDPQGRCANCIRLKKECNFYPVEHSSDMQRPQAVASKDSNSGQPATPTSCSPSQLVRASGEKANDFRPPFNPSAPPPSNYGYQGEPDSDSHANPSSGMPVQQAPYPYPHIVDAAWPPAHNFLPSSTLGESPTSSSTSYWRQSPSTANSAYGSESNVSGSHTPAALSASSSMSFGPQDSHWGQQPPFHPPTRSMSYGNIEGLSSPYPGRGLGIQHEMPRHTSSYPFPASIDTNPATLHSTTVGSSTSAPLSAPIMPNHQFYASNWNSFEPPPTSGQPLSISGRSMSAQWYSEPGHLDRVQEEGPAMAYNHAGLQPFYSGA